LLGECICLAREYDFPKQNINNQIPQKSFEAAGDILNKLETVEKLLIDKVHSQSSI